MGQITLAVNSSLLFTANLQQHCLRLHAAWIRSSHNPSTRILETVPVFSFVYASVFPNCVHASYLAAGPLLLLLFSFSCISHRHGIISVWPNCAMCVHANGSWLHLYHSIFSYFSKRRRKKNRFVQHSSGEVWIEISHYLQKHLPERQLGEASKGYFIVAIQTHCRK